jgi:hypothetical protein
MLLWLSRLLTIVGGVRDACGLPPRAPGDSMGPRRLSDVVGRPLKLTVRRPSQALGLEVRP